MQRLWTFARRCIQPAVCLKGDVGDLFKRFGSLTASQIFELRGKSSFADYRQRYAEAEAKGHTVWDDRRFAKDISGSAIACLQEIGKACKPEVTFERVASSKLRLVFPASIVVGGLLITGPAIVSGEYVGEWFCAAPFLELLVKIGAHGLVERAGEKIIDTVAPQLKEWTIHLSAQLRPVSGINPAVVNVACIGGVETPDVAN